jgi:hypothetical protein
VSGRRLEWHRLPERHDRHPDSARSQCHRRSGHGLIGAVVVAWSAVALVGSYELLMMIVRSAPMPTVDPARMTMDTLPIRSGSAKLLVMPRRPMFFVSHSMLDANEVEKVNEAIGALGVDVYLAEHDPQPGTNVAAKVTAAIRASDAVVVLLTNSAAESPWVQQEIGVAHQAEKLIVPVRQSGVDVNMGILAGIEWIEADFGDPVDAMAVISSALAPLVHKHAERQRTKELERQRTQELLLVLVAVAAILVIANSR